MKPYLALAASFALALPAPGQAPPVRIYTNPKIPPREVLERLNLTVAWSTRLKLEGSRDGFFSAEVIPPVGKKNPQLLLQTVRGTVALLDGENGDPLWRAQVGPAYQVMQAPGFNSQAIFTSRRERLHVLDRDSGAELLYDVERTSNLPVWGMPLEGVPSAGLTADEDQLYICLGQRVSGYNVPDYRKLRKYRALNEALPSGKLMPSPEVPRVWTNVLSPLVLHQRPLAYKDILGLVSTDGTFVHINTFEGKDTFRYQVEKAVVARVAQYEGYAYIGSDDFHVYALDMASGRVKWRFSGMAPIRHPVAATLRDVWTTPDRRGLFRIDRKTGAQRWHQRDAEQFLATNHQYVYATDRHGHLLVLDYENGTRLAKYDTRDWTVLVPNEVTDRIYLAAHDGQILCLRHGNAVKPVMHRPTAPEAPKVPPKKDKGKDKGVGVGAAPAGATERLAELRAAPVMLTRPAALWARDDL